MFRPQFGHHQGHFAKHFTDHRPFALLLVYYSVTVISEVLSKVPLMMVKLRPKYV
jgi:hypothetical protein